LAKGDDILAHVTGGFQLDIDANTSSALQPLTQATNPDLQCPYVANMDSGDKFFVSFHDSSAVKDGKPQDVKGTWMYTGGTGKLKGIRGKGTCTVTPNADGTSLVDVEGD
jgi:hypothetical protein